MNRTRRTVCLLCALAPVVCAQTGHIRGELADRANGRLRGAAVKITPPDSTRAPVWIFSKEGVFQTPPLPPGSYTVTVLQAGFVSRSVKNVFVRADETTNLGLIYLEVGGCDAPGVICDSVGDADPPPRARGYLTLKALCGADVEMGKVHCPEPNPPSSAAQPPIHFILTADSAGRYFTAVNGAKFSPLDPSHGAPYTEDRIRVDGVGEGEDLLLHTPQGHEVHIFFVHDIKRDTSEIRFWFVTW